MGKFYQLLCAFQPGLQLDYRTVPLIPELSGRYQGPARSHLQESLIPLTWLHTFLLPVSSSNLLLLLAKKFII